MRSKINALVYKSRTAKVFLVTPPYFCQNTLWNTMDKLTCECSPHYVMSRGDAHDWKSYNGTQKLHTGSLFRNPICFCSCSAGNLEKVSPMDRVLDLKMSPVDRVLDVGSNHYTTIKHQIQAPQLTYTNQSHTFLRVLNSTRICTNYFATAIVCVLQHCWRKLEDR